MPSELQKIDFLDQELHFYNYLSIRKLYIIYKSGKLVLKLNDIVEYSAIISART